MVRRRRVRIRVGERFMRRIMMTKAQSRLRVSGENCTFSGVDSAGYVLVGGSVTATAKPSSDSSRVFEKWSITGSWDSDVSLPIYKNPITVTPKTALFFSPQYGTYSATWQCPLAALGGFGSIQVMVTPLNLCGAFSGKTPVSLWASIGAYRGTSPLYTNNYEADMDDSFLEQLYQGFIPVLSMTLTTKPSNIDQIENLISSGNSGLFRARATCSDGTTVETSGTVIVV